MDSGCNISRSIIVIPDRHLATFVAYPLHTILVKSCQCYLVVKSYQRDPIEPCFLGFVAVIWTAILSKIRPFANIPRLGAPQVSDASRSHNFSNMFGLFEVENKYVP